VSGEVEFEALIICLVRAVLKERVGTHWFERRSNDAKRVGVEYLK